MKDNTGQVALEYLLIFAVSMILLVVFTLPLAEHSIQNTLDVSDTLDAKADLEMIAQAIREVYGQGQGSKQTVDIISDRNIKVNVANNHVSCNMILKDGSIKNEKIYFKSTLEKSSINLKKGENSLTVYWPVDNENMQIYTK